MKRFLLILCALVIALLPFALSQRLEITHYTLPGGGLSSDATLAVVSDLHNSFFGDGQAQLMDEIRSARPDALLMLGDMAEGMDSMDGVLALVNGLGGEFPIYYVSGNHEGASGELEAIKESLRAAGVRVLEGEEEKLPCGAYIAGADDPISLYRDEWQAQVDACRGGKERFTVFMSHRPDRVDAYARGFDVVLSGHAHGGQVRIPGIMNGLWASNQGLLPDYTGGMYELEEGCMIVSRGLCKNALPRVFNRPELIILHLQADIG